MNINNFNIIKTIPSFDNKIYVVQKNTSQYIFKIITSDIAFRNELYTLKFLQWNNISPSIIDYDIENNSLLIELLQWEHYSCNSKSDIIALWSLLKKLHELLRNYSEDTCNELFSINDCIKNIEQELYSWVILSKMEKDLLMKTLKYIEKVNFENWEKQIIHNDIKAENIISNKFIDFEKTWEDYVLKDIARAVVRIWKWDKNFEEILLKSYWTKKNNNLELFKIYDCLFSISYYIYKWYRNNYPYKNISFKILNNIIY